MTLRTVALLGLASALAGTAAAHHGFGNFAMNKDIELTGFITRLDFVNPHSWVHFDVTDEKGQTAEYRCELRSATTLRRSGWTPEMFKIGSRITIQGSPDRHDPHACYTSTLTFADGTRLDRYSQRISANAATKRAARLPNGDPNISGDWAVEQRVMTDPKGREGTLVPLSEAGRFAPGAVPEGQRAIPGARGTPEAAQGRNPLATFRPPPVVGLTEAGKAAMQALADIPRAQRSCMAGSIVSEWGGEPVNRVKQSGDAITLQYGRSGLERTIHMNMRAHPKAIEPSRAGHSIGHWENGVLVVDTVGFPPGTLTGATPNSAQLHVVERFSLDPEGMRLKREFTAEDPLYYTGTYSGSETMIVSNVPFHPEPCADLTPP